MRSLADRTRSCRKKMKQLTKQEESARRFAFWNGYDVSSSQGVRAIIASLDKERPEHVWLSLECGPFSKMQQVNQRTEKQRQELKEKRESCMKSYVGGLLIYIHCVQHGVPVTWDGLKLATHGGSLWFKTCSTNTRQCFVSSRDVGLTSKTPATTNFWERVGSWPRHTRVWLGPWSCHACVLRNTLHAKVV